MLRCGESYTCTYIKPGCVCSFYNEATFYHSYSSCPEGTKSDMVTQLKCCYRNEYNEKCHFFSFLISHMDTQLKLKFRPILYVCGLRDGGIFILAASFLKGVI